VHNVHNLRLCSGSFFLLFVTFETAHMAFSVCEDYQCINLLEMYGFIMQYDCSLPSGPLHLYNEQLVFYLLHWIFLPDRK
jgi:hypothetical protein